MKHNRNHGIDYHVYLYEYGCPYYNQKDLAEPLKYSNLYHSQKQKYYLTESC